MVYFLLIPTPIFDGSNFYVWSCRMEVYLSSLGFDVWMLVVNGCPSKVSPPIDSAEERRNWCNNVAMKAILTGLSGDVSSQVDKCILAKSL